MKLTFSAMVAVLGFVSMLAIITEHLRDNLLQEM